MSEPSFAQYWDDVQVKRPSKPELRLGQLAFNVLFEYRPDLCLEVQQNGLDPFYHDDRMPEFLRFVEGGWACDPRSSGELPEEPSGPLEC